MARQRLAGGCLEGICPGNDNRPLVMVLPSSCLPYGGVA